jgi:hypothetical protein
MRITPHLRIEAGPARWEEFDLAQRKACLNLARMIVDAVEELRSPDSDSGGTPDSGGLSGLRRTRAAFLAGDRGTGKTTVMASLMRDSQPRNGPHENAELNKMRGRVVWLETLDMEPLPRNANLIAAILARLEDAAKSYGASLSANSSPRGLLEPSSEYHTALLELQRLQTDVALAWDGNLPERQGQLDPDAYAVEVMRIEKARLSINAKFIQMLNQRTGWFVRLWRVSYWQVSSVRRASVFIPGKRAVSSSICMSKHVGRSSRETGLLLSRCC